MNVGIVVAFMYYCGDRLLEMNEVDDVFDVLM